ncbi:superkiller protein 3 [Pisolithus marmoratus]|nr:superkiller protein 3 [Pisolithus marmoratus]
MSSSFVKSKLKVARDALGKKQYEAARDAASQVLDYEPDNYNAHVFLGLAYLELGHHDKSEKLYRRAIELKPDQVLAWQGISRLYEQKEQWDAFASSLEEVLRIFSACNDATKVAETLQKLIDTRRRHGSRKQIIAALSYLLMDSPFYDVLSALPPPDYSNPNSTTTFITQEAVHNSLPVIEEIMTLTEKEEETFMKVEFDKRRTRLGAPPPDILRNEIGLEMWRTSKLPHIYEEVLNHPKTSDELRRSVEAKIIRYKQQILHALPLSDPDKSLVGMELAALVDGIVAIGIRNQLAWSIFLEGTDKETVCERGLDVLRRYIQAFPDTDLAQLLRGYFMYMNVPVDENIDSEADESSNVMPTLASNNGEPFSAVMDAFGSQQDSILATQVVIDVYLQELDYLGVIHVAENGLGLVKKYEQNTGRTLGNVRKAFNVALATALVHSYPLKHHQRAGQLLDDVLKQDPGHVDALLAYGYILQRAKRWEEAGSVFSKAIERLPPGVPKCVRAREERAWCLSRIRIIEGVQALRDVLKDLESGEFKLDRARCLWRIGRACWDLGGAFREEAYANFIQSLRCDPEYAPSYTSLGVYYSEFAVPPDLTRASKCFQKAFELSPTEVEAARRLAEGFANEREWDLVEVVARRTIEGEGLLDLATEEEGGLVVGRYLPANGWAWKALGVVELSRQNYVQSIEALQIALRADEEDQVCWLRLGEAYSKAGRYAAALKALARANELNPDDWLCTYLIGEVQRQTGKLGEALYSYNSVLRKRPDEVGVLISLALTELALAREEWISGFFVRAEQTFASTISTSLSTVEASSGYGGIAWKLIGDALLGLSGATTFADQEVIRDILVKATSMLQHVTSKRIAHVFTLSPIQDGLPLTGSHALQAAVASYDYRITIGSTDDIVMGSALYDLGLALHAWSKEERATGRDSALEVASSLLKEALYKDPNEPTYWTALAITYFLDRPKISQHAYIKALELDPKNTIAWTQLGLLYLYYSDVALAYEALSKAHILDPDCSITWVGLALVASSNGADDHAHALLEHAIGLYPLAQPAATVELAARLFRPMSSQVKSGVLAKEELLPAFAALNLYAKQRQDDARALHLLGLICERLEGLEQGAEWIRRATTLLEVAYEDTEDSLIERQFTIAHTNLARLKIGLHDYTGALESFDIALGLLPEQLTVDREREPEIGMLRVQVLFGSGLAHFKLGDFQSAMARFQAALDATVDNHVLRGHVTVLLAQCMWAVGTDELRESAKALLLDSITADPENLMSISTLAGMGFLTEDDSLVDAALSEIQSLPIERRQELDPRADVTYLLIQHHLGLADIGQAVQIAQKALHIEPSSLRMRRDLALLTLKQGNKAATQAILAVASAVRILEEAKETLALACITDDRGKGRSLSYAQKAIMLDPGNVQNWKTLAYVHARNGDL